MATANGTAAAMHTVAATCIGTASGSNPGVEQGVGSAAAAAALQLLQEFLQVQACRAEVYSRFNQGFRELLDNGQESAFARLMREVTPLFNAASQQVISIESGLKAPAVNRPDLAALLRGVQEQERSKLKLTLSWQALRAAHAAGRFSWQDAADRPRTQGAAAADSQRQHQQQQEQQQQLLAMLEEMQLQTTQAPGGGCDVAAGSNDQQGGRSSMGAAAAVKPGFYEQQMQRAVADALAANSGSSSSAQEQQSSSHGSGSAGQQAAGKSQCQHGGHCQHGHAPPSDPLEPNNPLEPNEAEYRAAVREALQELDGCVAAINELLEEVREAAMDLQQG